MIFCGALEAVQTVWMDMVKLLFSTYIMEQDVSYKIYSKGFRSFFKYEEYYFI
jgi:hypothetical protein